MSYILEALKKSQQERELGQVPTLDTSALFGEDKEPPRPNYWGGLAVGLASLAVVIALYAAFRTPGSSTLVDGGQAISADADMRLPESAVPSASDPAAADGMSEPADASPPMAPLVEAPAPKRPLQRAVSAPRDEDVQSGDIADQYADLEEELQRQLEAEADLDAAPVQPASPRRPAIPADLIEDIEAFKQQVRREQGIPPPKQGSSAKRIPSDPTSLRLTAKQQAQVPAYLMTAHVYDKDPAKRFVVINTLKYRQGEETREGLWVERIDPEGAVLSYMDSLFFVAR